MTTGPAIERVLGALPHSGRHVDERGSGTAMAQCPAAGHDDQTASLSVAQGDTGAVL